MYQVEVVEAPQEPQLLTNKDLVNGEIVQATGSKDVYAVTKTELINLAIPSLRFDRLGYTENWGFFRRFPKGTKITITV